MTISLPLSFPIDDDAKFLDCLVNLIYNEHEDKCGSQVKNQFNYSLDIGQS